MTTEFFMVKGGVASRAPIPEVFLGLSPADLLNPPKADPTLGLDGCAWWPGEDVSPLLQHGEQYASSGELLSLDVGRKVVLVKRKVEPWPAEQLAAHKAELIERINNAVVKASAKPQRFTQEYLRRETQARGYLNDIGALPAGSTPPPAPPLIAGFAASAGISELDAARRTVKQADDLYAKLDQLANLRMRKYEIERATTAAAAFAAFREVNNAIFAVAATIT